MSADQATSFGAEAANYEAGRPEYPFEAVAWMLEPMPAGSRRIVDVGAGTGKLTRVVAHAPGAEVVAVDPDTVDPAALDDIGAIGFVAFVYVDQHLIELAIAAITLIFTLRWFAGGGKSHGTPLTATWPNALPWGAMAGFTTFVAHSGGPPLQIYLLRRGLDWAAELLPDPPEDTVP